MRSSRWAKAWLAKHGVEVVRTNPHKPSYEQLKGKLEELAGEIEALFAEKLYPDLPPRAGRTRMLSQLIGTSVSEALYILTFLHRSLSADGDVCEFGVAQGATSALLATEIGPTDRHLWLFDSFEGLPAPSTKDVLIDDIFELGSIERYRGEMSVPESEVRRRLREVDFPPERTHVVRGFIEESVSRGELPGSVAFAYVDFDFFEPIRIALQLLHERLSPAGSIVVDDYGFFSAGAQAAVDEFLSGHEDCYDVVHPITGAGHFIVLTRRA